MTSQTVDASPPNTDVAAVHCTIHCLLFPDDRAYTVVVKDLHTQAMTHSALGTMEAPGTKAKAGLNREILATNWSQLEQRLDYQVGYLAKVDPAYTPQTCAACGHVHRDNRPSQAVFACGPVGIGRMPTTMRRSISWPVGHHRPVRPAGPELLHGEGRSRQGPQQPVNNNVSAVFHASCYGWPFTVSGLAPLRPSHPVPTVLATFSTACPPPVASRANINE